MARKPGVSEPSEIRSFIEAAGDNIVVVDARNPDFSTEPGDEATSAKAALGNSDGTRPKAVNIPFIRPTASMDLSLLPSSVDDKTCFITHCGGGGRGQKAKDFLIANGFKPENVLNGGGPEDEDTWAEFGTL